LRFVYYTEETLDDLIDTGYELIEVKR